MAEDVANFIHENGLQAPTIIGHSMGAKTAMTLALKSPELVKDLIPVDNAPIDAALIGRFGTYIQGMKRIEEAGITKQSDADKILQEYEKSLPIRQFLLTNLYKPDGQDTRKFRVPLSILAKALDHLGDFPYKNPGEVRFEGPALFVRGTESKYVPDEVLPIIGQFFPRFELADIEAGHWVISEKPEEFRQGAPARRPLLLLLPVATTQQQHRPSRAAAAAAAARDQLLLQPARHGVDELDKRPAHVVARLGARLAEERAVLPRQRRALVRAHGAVARLGPVELAADEGQHRARRRVGLGLAEPAAHGVEAGAARGVVDEHDAVGAAVVARRQGAEAFLASLGVCFG
ncbi:uncharacterized protein E0L32_004695 [Thyridium curvatum]|uniref:AB hydrolase-1 domain-containing protein n=1 Tax=Thyridium curvatum TaxID=1093900 RepID=A0A507B5U8_9PEZI|nr:uncharacterized protein E0L32_004695 [Thyridium curvatum]TPX15137.1 hypothetical protein E0L32_004695 [Thyridium curvatum]